HSQGSQSCYLAFALYRHNGAWERRAIVLVECNLGCWLQARSGGKTLIKPPDQFQRVLPSSNLFQSPRISFGAFFNKWVDSAAMAFMIPNMSRILIAAVIEAVVPRAGRGLGFILRAIIGAVIRKELALQGLIVIIATGGRIADRLNPMINFLGCLFERLERFCK